MVLHQPIVKSSDQFMESITIQNALMQFLLQIDGEKLGSKSGNDIVALK